MTLCCQRHHLFVEYLPICTFCDENISDSGSNKVNMVHRRAPLVEALHYSCQHSVDRWTSNMNQDRLSVLVVMARPTTPVRCSMQDWQTSNHALTTTEHDTQTHRTQHITRRGINTTKQKEFCDVKNDRRHDAGSKRN